MVTITTFQYKIFTFILKSCLKSAILCNAERSQEAHQVHSIIPDLGR
jgi:hypothetical protein